MSSRGLICALLLAVSTGAGAQDWGAFAARSDRTDDPALVQALGEEDFSTRLLICAGIGKREDLYAADIIASLMEKDVGNSSTQVEILLRTLLQGLFDPARGEQGARSAAAANGEALELMVGRIDRWTDPQMRSLLVRILPFLPAPVAAPALLKVGEDLVVRLRSANGLVPSSEMALALDYLASVETMRNVDSLEQCAALARLSRDKILVDRARAVARRLF